MFAPVSSLECTDTRDRRAPALESTLTNSLDLNSLGIRASWPFGEAEVLWRSARAITPLECTLTESGLISPLECTDTNSLDLKFRGITLFQKKGGRESASCAAGARPQRRGRLPQPFPGPGDELTQKIASHLSVPVS